MRDSPESEMLGPLYVPSGRSMNHPALMEIEGTNKTGKSLYKVSGVLFGVTKKEFYMIWLQELAMYEELSSRSELIPDIKPDLLIESTSSESTCILL
jgi:hypothetical protein